MPLFQYSKDLIASLTDSETCSQELAMEDAVWECGGEGPSCRRQGGLVEEPAAAENFCSFLAEKSNF